MPLDATFTHFPDQTVEVSLNGTMTLGSSLKMLESQIRSAISDGARHVVLNMEALSYMDSAGLGFLVLINAELASQAGSLTLRNVNQRIRDLLALTHTDSILKLDS
jgi:anti-anti-sigma factor